MLDNEKDIDSVLAGVSGKNELNRACAAIPKQQALIRAVVPMPVAFQPREYGSAKSYASFGSAADNKPSADKKSVTDDLDKLWE